MGVVVGGVVVVVIVVVVVVVIVVMSSGQVVKAISIYPHQPACFRYTTLYFQKHQSSGQTSYFLMLPTRNRLVDKVD